QPGRTEGLELEVRPGHQVPHGAGHEDLARAGLGHHPSRDVDGDPTDLGTDDLDLAHVDPRSDLDAEALDVADDLLGAPDGLGRLVERGEEPVAGGVDLPPAVLLETATDERVVGVDDLVPPLAADLGGA